MSQIIQFFWRLCLLRENPAGLPTSSFSVGIVIIVYLLIGLSSVIFSQTDASFGAFLGSFAVSILVQITITLLLLEFKGYRHRFLRTWTALLGASSIVSVFMLVLTAILFNVESELLQQFAESGILVCILWWLAIAGYIYHKAVDISVIQGTAIAFAIEFVSFVFAFTLFPR